MRTHKYTNKKSSPSFGKISYDASALIIYDNGRQFIDQKMTEFFEKWRIKRILSTLYHPAANSLAESSNKTILNILKKKLEDA